MTRKSKKRQSENDALVKAERRVSRAQENLKWAQDKRVEVMRKGEEDVEKARALAARRLTAATTRVEKRTHVLVRAQDRLRALRPQETVPPARRSVLVTPHRSSPSPDDVADELEERMDAIEAEQTDGSHVIVPGVPDMPLHPTSQEASDAGGDGQHP